MSEPSTKDFRNTLYDANLDYEFFTLAVSGKDMERLCNCREISEISFVRLLTTMKHGELNILEKLKGSDEYDVCKSWVVGRSHPTDEGYYFFLTKHSIMIVKLRETGEELMFQCNTNSQGVITFSHHEHTGNNSDYFISRFTKWHSQEDLDRCNIAYFESRVSKPKLVN